MGDKKKLVFKKVGRCSMYLDHCSGWSISREVALRTGEPAGWLACYLKAGFLGAGTPVPTYEKFRTMAEAREFLNKLWLEVR